MGQVKQLDLFTAPAQRVIVALGGTGKLTESDVPELNAAALRILFLLSDGQWHTATKIIEASQQREGLRRLRQLRQAGYEINSRRMTGEGREWEYQLVSKPLQDANGSHGDGRAQVSTGR